MKNLITILFVLFSLTVLNAQTQTDVLYLKNGSVIKCKVMEELFGVSVKIKASDGSIYVYKAEEIEKITHETSDSPAVSFVKPTAPAPSLGEMNSYGGTVGLGVALGGGGVLGMPLRFNLSKHIAFETSATVRPALIQYQYPSETYNEWFFPIMLTAEFDFFGNPKFKPRANKIVKNGLTLFGGISTSVDVPISLAAIGWSRERFRLNNKKHSYIFSLGAGIQSLDLSAVTGESSVDGPTLMPMLLLRFHWNWYFKSDNEIAAK